VIDPINLATMQRETRIWDEREFASAGLINPLLDQATGGLIEEMPQSRYTDRAGIALSRYGAGPFCRFKIAQQLRQTCLYLIVANDEPVYAGECQNLAARFGPNGYGAISPRNCFKGGQETNCRINNLILQAARRGEVLSLWFLPTLLSKSERVDLEWQVIRTLRPGWNQAVVHGW